MLVIRGFESQKCLLQKLVVENAKAHTRQAPSGDGRQPLPLLVYTVTIAICLTDASCSPATYLVNHVGRTLHGPQAVSERVSEGVDDTSLWHPWTKPLVDGG